MAITIDFPNPLRDWIARNLGRGVAAPDIVSELIAQRTPPELAAAMVGAVAHALAHGTPLADGKLILDPHEHGAGAPYRAGAMRLPSGPRILAHDREICVLARMARPSTAILADVLDAEECLGMFFRPGETPLIERIERRIACLTGLPMDHGEGLQILRYPTGAENTPHFDYLMPTNAANRDSLARSGQRVCTLIMYLNEVPAGGETTFPESGWTIVPRRGHALSFEYGNAAGQTDPASLHAGAPVRAGEKWIATKWLRSRKFMPRGG
ncbi:2OG-Fe(II) oxygenase [Bordetella bronchialis]|uniref:Fe2OG dioxygenase domain-containing protein n=1 Tax=Bordetella bronchialis TaxID=463025 RepID=A0A193G4G2_9BORD|nr:2OG-Fe(II) oxygenase [Bordetella bronchialis]ANN74588.1 hypothetical protein BAU08_05600 [Bordetella bronchialis]